MKPTDFAKHLTEFLSVYLPTQKNVCKNTILSYRDSFKILIRYFDEVKSIPVERLRLKDLSSKFISDFLEWLETDRNCSISTRNLRLAAIHSFFRYVQAEEPAGIYHYQKISAIPIKKSQSALVGYLSYKAIKLLLEQPCRNNPKGRRDLTLLSILYDSGARVQELIDLRVCDLSLQNPEVIILTGKGKKSRRVPLMKNTSILLQHYLIENKLDQPYRKEHSLFTNNKLTKEGVAYILAKYVTLACQASSIIPHKVTVHMIRHSKAMHLLQAGVNLIYIRDFLGHVDIKTTEVYAKADTEMKRKALENIYPDLVDSELPDWTEDQTLLAWLSKLR